MQVTRILVNHGQFAREGGFANGRLDSSLGIVNQGAGARFAYAFQIAFQLQGIASSDVKLVRRVNHKTHYKQARITTADDVIAILQTKPLRHADPKRSEDSPNEGNVKRAAGYVIVQDGPGPSFGINDASMYPMAFEGKFILMAQNTAGGLLASVEYYVCLLKREHGGKVEGFFELVHETIVPEPPPPPRDFTIQVHASWPTDSVQLSYAVRTKRNVERKVTGTLGFDGKAVVSGFNPDQVEIRFPEHSSFWSNVRLGETCMLPSGRYSYVCR